MAQSIGYTDPALELQSASMTRNGTSAYGRKSDAYSYRRDPLVPHFSDEQPIIIFDGYCALCSGWAQFVLRHDRVGRYRLLPAQSALGRALYIHYGLNPDEYETNILVEDGHAWFKSEGSIRMAEGLGFPWSFASIFRALPRNLTDWLYSGLARNRLRVFGKRDSCYIGDGRNSDRFLS